MSVWTEADLAAHYARQGAAPSAVPERKRIIGGKEAGQRALQVMHDAEAAREKSRLLEAQTGLPPFPKARARSHTPGQMNSTERSYSEHLKMRVLVREVLAWWFERWTVKLGPDCRLTPDFMLHMADGTIEFHDVKGSRNRKNASGTAKVVAYVEEDAQVKLATAAQQFPLFRFVMVWRDGENWQEKELVP